MSPFNDNTFEFRTIEISSHFQFLYRIGKNFILNQPFKEIGVVRSTRRISSLKKLYEETLNYIVIDVDDVNSKANMLKVVEYFKDYKCILGESYSYDGVNNFRLKGILFCEDGSFKEIQTSLQKIESDLKEYCKIDTSRGFIPSYNAPSKKAKPILNNEHGKLWKHERFTHVSKPSSLKTIKTVDYSECQTIEEVCLTYFESIGFECVKPKDGGFVFKHYSEIKSPCGFSWYNANPYQMIHWNNSRSVNAFSEILKIPKSREILKNSLDYDSQLLNFNPRSSLIKVNQEFLTVDDEMSEKISEFIEMDRGIFAIRSPMGTGKSTVIRSIIEEAIDSGLRCLIITNRISVAEDFGEKYNLKLYLDSKYNLGDSLICQFDSLWKYDLKYFDLVIMDEFISLMSHVRSELNNSSLNLIKFYHSFNKKLVIADAFLTGYEKFLLNDDKTYFLENEYRDDTELFDYKDKNLFVLRLLQIARHNRITVSSTSLSFLEDLRSLLQDNGIRTVSLTSETPVSTKKLIYGLFNLETHDKYDALLYSPTLTVGVSNLNDVDYHFHYDSSNSADVISSIQMMKRTRKSKQIHMYIRPGYKYLETNYEKLRNHYIENIGKMSEFNLMFKVNDYGDIQLSEIGKKTIKIDIFKNILETNHRDAVLWFLKCHFKNEPVVIDKMFDSNILLRHSRQNKTNKQLKRQQAIEEFLNLTNVEKFESLNSDSSDIKKLSEIHEQIDLIELSKSNTPNQIKTRILELGSKDSGFILNCKCFKLMNGYLNKSYSDDDIRFRMQESIAKSETELTKFYTCLLKSSLEYSDSYELKIATRNPNKTILEMCGYKHHSTVGKRFLSIQDSIKELSMFIMV